MKILILILTILLPACASYVPPHGCSIGYKVSPQDGCYEPYYNRNRGEVNK